MHNSSESSQEVQTDLKQRTAGDVNKVEGGVEQSIYTCTQYNVVLTMVRKLHSIALMLNLPLLHTGQMVLH